MIVLKINEGPWSPPLMCSPVSNRQINRHRQKNRWTDRQESIVDGTDRQTGVHCRWAD